jgi:hypothetical protein
MDPLQLYGGKNDRAEQNIHTIGPMARA